MEKKRKNKKGGAPIAILIFVVGVIAVCIFALISFVISMSKTSGIIIEANTIGDMNNKIDLYYFYKNSNSLTNDEIMNLLGANTDHYGRKYLYTEEVRGSKKIIYVQYYPQA
jgi:hypothetical protein